MSLAAAAHQVWSCNLFTSVSDRSNYGLIFGIAGTAYLAALLLFHLLVPRMQTAAVNASPAR